MKRISLYACLVTLVLLSCKKDSGGNDDDNNNNPPQTDKCLLIKRSRANFNDHHYEYDAQKRLVKSTFGNSIRTFTYNGDVVKVEVSSDGGQTVDHIRTVTLNSHKLATNVRLDYTAGHWENTAYEYDGTRVVKKIYKHYTSSNPSVTTYEWSNGNLVKEISPGGSITTYAYDADELFQTADYFGSNYYEFGIRTIMPKNRVNKIVTQSGTYDIGHFENAEGRITGYNVDITPGADYTVNFHYQCN